MDLVGPAHTVRYIERIAHTGMVAAEERAPLRDMFPVDGSGGLENAIDWPDEDIRNDIDDIQACSRSLIVLSST